MSRHSFKVPYRPIPDINVTSLVDVTLVLLIVFMVAAPIMKSS
ncbi:biopolymer transporter ExbD, partial [bacterium]|nr:biopolymer transporter ExbD [bacterium]MBU1983176.1 biopolymer transporter ExbD [bacterium]